MKPLAPDVNTWIIQLHQSHPHKLVFSTPTQHGFLPNVYLSLTFFQLMIENPATVSVTKRSVPQPQPLTALLRSFRLRIITEGTDKCVWETNYLNNSYFCDSCLNKAEGYSKFACKPQPLSNILQTVLHKTLLKEKEKKKYYSVKLHTCMTR